MIALDSNVVIDVLRGREPVRGRLEAARNAETAIFLSSLAFEEVLFGVHRKVDPRQAEEAFLIALEGVEIVAFETRDADLAASLRARMASRGVKAPQLDFLIGAHALSRGHTLVTANTRDFRNIPGLQLQDWTQPPQTQDAPHA